MGLQLHELELLIVIENLLDDTPKDKPVNVFLQTDQDIARIKTELPGPVSEKDIKRVHFHYYREMCN